MKLFIGSIIGLVLSVHVGAEPTLEGRMWPPRLGMLAGRCGAGRR